MLNLLKKNYGDSIRKNYIFRAIGVLSKKDKARILLIASSQVFLGLLDLLGVAAIGVLGTLAVVGFGSGKTGNRVNGILSFLRIENMSFQYQVSLIGIIAAALLITRTAFSIFITKKTVLFLSRRAAAVSIQFLGALISRPLTEIQSRTSQQTLFFVTNGIDIIFVNLIGSSITLFSDLSLLFILTAGLVAIDINIAISTLLIFGTVGLILFKMMYKKARHLGSELTSTTISLNQRIIKMLSSYRETVVRNRRGYYLSEIEKVRSKQSLLTAKIGFMPNISKYAIELTIVLGGLLIAGSQFLLKDGAHAVATLSVFLAAGTRIAPAVLRMQQSALSIRTGSGMISTTLDLLEETPKELTFDLSQTEPKCEYLDFTASIKINNLHFSYPNSEKVVINDVNFEISEGSTVAVVGSSGAGKTTLIDLLLGILEPSKGNVEVSGLDPKDAIRKWTGAISYMPQNIMITNGTIRENVMLGFKYDQSSSERVIEALVVSELFDFVSGLPQGIETIVGENGTRLSGGQRQRLGIARSLYTNPKLLVLDEATSSLDGETEANISTSLSKLKGVTTIIMIAHRLSSIRLADKVIYMSQGKVLKVGTFEEVREAVPDFDRQANILGL